MSDIKEMSMYLYYRRHLYYERADHAEIGIVNLNNRPLQLILIEEILNGCVLPLAAI